MMRAANRRNEFWGRYGGYLLAAWLVGAASGASAANPSLGSVSPPGGQRGTEQEFVLGGGNLADALEVHFYEPGIEVKHFEVVGDNQVKVRVAIAPECRLGIHDLRLRTATGISNLRTFHVGALPQVAEAEPNSEFAQPQKIALNTTVTGVIETEDVDYFLVEAAKGTRITAEIEGIRMGNTFFDPYLAIMNAGRFELASSDDSALVWQDGVASLVAPEDGNYIIQVRETAFGGNGACIYRLHVGTFPRPRAVIPSGGKLGSQLTVRYLGDVLGEISEELTLPAEPQAGFGLFAHDAQGIAPSPNVFRLSALDNVLETEPNNGLAEAPVFTAPAALHGVIGEPGDTDCFKFSAKQGAVYDIQVYARTARSPLDSLLYIYNAQSQAVVANDDNGGPDSYVRFTAPADGDYIVWIKDHLGQGGADYAYRIEVAPVQASLTMTLPEQQQFVDVTASIPKGNRFAVLVGGNRANFGGELALDLRNLPPGVTVETLPMPANHGTVPVLLTAAADAPLSGALVDIVGKLTDPNQPPIEGHLSQMTSLVRGQNNIHVWTRTTQRMATAVTDEAPFSIEIVEPKAPLVRGGQMNLKVRATRKEGFTAPIAIRLLYNPSDVGSAGSVAIAEGQTEGEIPMNAGGGAEVRTWKIVVLGEAATPKGAIVVASQMANLAVAEPFVGFTYQAAAVEQGKETDVVIQVAKNRDFDGPATVELLGLPNEVTTAPQEITKETTELVFRVKTTANSPAGKHPTLICRAAVPANGEPSIHMLGTGELRIDTPLPPKADAPPPAATAAAPTPEAAPMPEKRLTRLEQLRLERKQQKERAAAAAQAPPAEGAPATAPSGGN